MQKDGWRIKTLFSDLWTNEGDKSDFFNTYKKDYIMIYIAFSSKTHKLYAKIVCKRFKHCAPVYITKTKCTMYQFVNRNNISEIILSPKNISLLKAYGWVFIKYKCSFNPENAIKNKPLNCVQFTKQSCNIKNKHILTPYDLFKYLDTK